MTPILFLAALLSVADPQGDAIGQGNLTPPTAVVFRAPGIFDIQQITVPDAETFGFELTIGQLPNPWRLANGFSFPIIEVYLSTKSGGQNTLLPGSNMRLPEGQGWHYAFRMTGDRFDVYRATEQGMPVPVTDMIGAQLEVTGNTLHVRTNLPLPERYSIFGMVGSYDPFTETGWRVVTDTPNPWAFSSREPSVPVIDVIADSFSMQRAALARGVLPEIRSAVRQDSWLIVAAVGFAFMVVAAFGQLLLPKRPTKRSLVAANQAIKATQQTATKSSSQPAYKSAERPTKQPAKPSAQAAKQAPTQPKKRQPAPTRPAAKTPRQPVIGRSGRGANPVTNGDAARGQASQRPKSSGQTPTQTPNQPVSLGDKLVLAPTADAATVAAQAKTLRPPPRDALKPRLAPQMTPARSTQPAVETDTSDMFDVALVTDTATDTTTDTAPKTANDTTTDTATETATETDTMAAAHAERKTSSQQASATTLSQQASSPQVSPRQGSSSEEMPPVDVPQVDTPVIDTEIDTGVDTAPSVRTPRQTPTLQPAQASPMRSRREPASARAKPSKAFQADTSQGDTSQASPAQPTHQTKMPAKPSAKPPAKSQNATADTSQTDTPEAERAILPAERIRRERLARKSQGWEEGFFDDGWFDWQTSQAIFDDDANNDTDDDDDA